MQQKTARVALRQRVSRLAKPRLHDTTGCQNGCTTGLTTALTTGLTTDCTV